MKLLKIIEKVKNIIQIIIGDKIIDQKQQQQKKIKKYYLMALK